jgi:hypothetical protein
MLAATLRSNTIRVTCAWVIMLVHCKRVSWDHLRPLLFGATAARNVRMWCSALMLTRPPLLPGCLLAVGSSPLVYNLGQIRNTQVQWQRHSARRGMALAKEEVKGSVIRKQLGSGSKWSPP